MVVVPGGKTGPLDFPDDAGSGCPSPGDARGGCPEGGATDVKTCVVPCGATAVSTFVTNVTVFLLPDSEDVLDFKLEVRDLSRAKSLAPTFVLSTFWL